MKIRSFQFKIALVSLLLSGLSLCVFGLLAWTFFYRMGLDRIDREIKSWGQMQLSKYRVLREWERFERDMNLVFGQQGQRDAAVLLVKDRQGRVLYQSADWPVALNPNQFPSPQELKIPAAEPPSDATRGLGSEPPGRRRQPWDELHFTVPAKFRMAPAGGRAWRIGVMANAHATLALGVNLESFLAEMGRVRLAFLTALPAALLLIALAGWLVSRRALRPVQRVTRTAKSITAQGLDQRIPIRTEDHEFEELVSVLNQMLDRLQMSFQQAIRFSADAAHELKTPLTILHGELEEALRAAPEGSGQQQIFLDLMDEVQRLKAIIQKLLLLAKADAGQLRLNIELVDLTCLIEEMIEDTTILAPNLSIMKDLMPQALVRADAELLRQALQNLASNAIKYNRPDGSIFFRLGCEDTLIRFTIANTGDPIPPEDRDRIFDRFYRGDKSRSRRVDGVGLGLNLAREIVNAHQGKLILDESTDGMTTFVLLLPKP